MLSSAYFTALKCVYDCDFKSVTTSIEMQYRVELNMLKILCSDNIKLN